MAEPDIFAKYQAGLHKLLSRLSQEDARYADALIYQQRLSENADHHSA